MKKETDRVASLFPLLALELNIQFGLIQSIFDFLEPVVNLDPKSDNAFIYWVPSACASIGFRFADIHVLSVRVGCGISMGYNMGKWQKPGFMPNLAIEYGFRLKR